MGINENAQEFADQWRTVLIKGRDDSRKLINESYTRMEDYFAGLAQKKSSTSERAVQPLSYPTPAGPINALPVIRVVAASCMKNFNRQFPVL
jgi:hypothetical protein